MKVRLMYLVKPKSEKVGPIAQFDSDGFVFVAELMNCTEKDFVDDQEYEANVTFFCHKVYGIYLNAEEFQADNPSMAEESYIPMGAFPANPEDKNWKPSPINYINSTVKEVADNEKIGAPENLVVFYGEVEGQRLKQVLFYESKEEKDELKPGYIMSGMYWAELRLLSNKEAN